MVKRTEQQPTVDKPIDIFGIQVPLRAWSMALQILRGWKSTGKNDMTEKHLVAMAWQHGYITAQREAAAKSKLSEVDKHDVRQAIARLQAIVDNN